MLNRLWSPWRSAYVSDASARADADKTGQPSVFARLEQERRDADNLILWRGAHVFVIMNVYPYNNGHLLVVPYREVGTYTALTADERHALADAVDRCMRWLNEALSPDGVNVGINIGEAAGAGIPEHMHAHVVPRWRADTNFMTTTNETRVLPEDLTVTYEKLRAAMTPDEADAYHPASGCNDS